ncbi:hypothetical protein Sjap_017172 [Stephania japonica]|uniref:Bet v I/Major latex protein domain-containing protein n=1 Tax=Stephania japonica TaxID=461633 RepID=A0AAP0I5N3_9MAGN
MIRKELTYDLEVAAPAEDIFGVYSSIKLDLYLLVQLLPGVFEKHEVLAGDGDVGTLIYVKFVPGIYPNWFKEKFVTVDRKNHLKEVEMIEGGYLDMGCTYYLDSIHVIEKGPESCVIASKVTYEVPNEEVEKKVAPYISTTSLESMASVISKYVLNKRKKSLLHKLQVAASAKDEYWDAFGPTPSDSLPKLMLKVLPSVFKDMEIVKSNDGLGAHELRITIPPGLVGSLPVTTKEKWCGPKSLKKGCLYLMCIASIVLMVFLSSRVMAYKN